VTTAFFTDQAAISGFAFKQLVLSAMV